MCLTFLLSTGRITVKISIYIIFFAKLLQYFSIIITHVGVVQSIHIENNNGGIALSSKHLLCHCRVSCSVVCLP